MSVDVWNIVMICSYGSRGRDIRFRHRACVPHPGCRQLVVEPPGSSVKLIQFSVNFRYIKFII